ncbi:MAG: drug/metabolite transporter (DMT)-like permease [Alphaproteobacteria bacterium]|jgi:drug/metabolite transporter (DMT)-like permease
MTTIVFVAVISAAALHAVWNALAKGGTDKHLSMTAVALGHTPIALAALAFVPTPTPESWPYIAVGMVLHTGYQLVLLAAYRIGDLTQVYPIARGTAPLIVAGVSTVFLGVTLAPLELLAVLTIALGILSLGFVRQQDGTRNGRASLLAFITGCFIASYSLIDGTGARISGSALGFYSWVAIGNSVLFAAYIAATKPGLLSSLHKAKQTFIIGGTASFVAYGIVIWAFTQAPIALVTALRETSIIFALVIGVWFLGEKLDLAKVFSTFVTLLGAAMLRLSKTS